MLETPTPSRVRRARFLEQQKVLLDQVEAVRRAGLYCVFPVVDRVDRRGGWVDGRRQILLVVNNYLGLATDDRVIRAAQSAIEEFGTSGCASPLMGGYTRIHRELAGEIAAFLHQEDAIITASGYQANLAIITALVGPGDLVLSDLCNHASIVDAARLSGADLRFFRHNSATHVEEVLGRLPRGRRVLVVVEGIYSVDGDLSELPDIVGAAHAHGALVVVDEAHSLGVLGSGGEGAVHRFGLEGDVDVIMGTMSKSLASVGGFAAGDRDLVDVIRNSARSLIFSAALPAASVASAREALSILRREPGLVERLWSNTRFFLNELTRRGFDTMESVTPVIVVLVGNLEATLDLSCRLRERGVLVCPVTPPMVPGHRCRIRIHVTAAHSKPDLEKALDVIEEVGGELGIRTSARRPPKLAADRQHLSGSGGRSPGSGGRRTSGRGTHPAAEPGPQPRIGQATPAKTP